MNAGYEERLQNQSKQKAFLKIEDKLDKVIFSIEYASFQKTYNERTSIKEFGALLIEIDTLMKLIKTDSNN